jgi:acyl-CoA thioesterase I
MRICFVGDSFVNGTGDDDCLGWVGRLCSNARQHGRDVTCYNLGIRRDTSADIAARWEAEVAARLPPEHDGRLVFSFGVNDCVDAGNGRTRIHLDESLANTRSILSRARARYPTLMIGPPGSGDTALDQRVKHLSERIATICDDVSVPFLSVWPVLVDNRIWREEARQGDGVHPNRGGYLAMHNAILSWQPWRDWIL